MIKAVAAVYLAGTWAMMGAAAAAASDGGQETRQIFDVRTPMRDGVQLSSDVWLPAAPGKYPLILVRTAYLKTELLNRFTEFGKFFASHGYAYAVQDVRGRGDSEGEFDFFFQEARDGHDAIEGLASQPWSNGRVCTMGGSYLGTVQWLAARERPPHLVCIAPASPVGNYFEETPYQGGAFRLSFSLFWLNFTSGNLTQVNSFSLDWEKIYRQRPLIESDEFMGRKMRLYREWLQHDTLDDYWKRIQFSPADFKKIDVPILMLAGQFLDGDQAGAMTYWQGMNEYSESKPDRYLMLGPWTHRQAIFGGKRQLGLLEFPQEAVIDLQDLYLRYFDRYLKQKTQTFEQPHAKIYVTGANRWRTFDEYPPRNTTSKTFFFASGGHANTAAGDGKLLEKAARRAGTDRYRFDPRDPPREVMAFNDDDVKKVLGDRREMQKRQDVLVYTSEKLEQTVEITGLVKVRLYAASDARDTDFVAKMSDVYPDGQVVPLGPVMGMLRARYRKGYEKDKVELLQPGKVEEYEIRLGHIGHAFLPGHRIRVEIASGSFPGYNPNQNTGNPVATDTEWKVANQTIHHGARWPSALVLPIVPEK